MIVTCDAEHYGSFKRDLCGRTFNDLTHSTICPHDPLPPKQSLGALLKMAEDAGVEIPSEGELIKLEELARAEAPPKGIKALAQDFARCPEHGLHGQRMRCYECGEEAEQVAMVPLAEALALEREAQDLRSVVAVLDADAAVMPGTWPHERVSQVIQGRDDALAGWQRGIEWEKATHQTLINVGADPLDENGNELTANGMLVDWLGGRRHPQWKGKGDPGRPMLCAEGHPTTAADGYRLPCGCVEATATQEAKDAA